ncbi:MAG: FMN-binding protein [Sarcina sp.]|nr:FMN-binding protein [Sarcina sp.]
MGKKRLFARVTSLLLSFCMVLSLGGFICPGGSYAESEKNGRGLADLLSTTVYAVTGSTVAADGTYSGSSSEGTVYVAVSGGKITSVTASVKSTYQSKITSAFSSVIGKAATYDNIDAVSMPTTKYLPSIKKGALSAISKAAAADGSGSGSGTEEPEEPQEESEIGQGVGTKTGTRYTGRAYVNGDTTDEWIELDVYVSAGKITGLFIAAQNGHWLDLLTSLKDSFLNVNAAAADVDAVSCATSLGFRETIQNAISNAVKNIDSGSSSQGSYTACASGTVSWQMIRDNPGTYYWIDDDGEYCLLTAVKSSSNYYVTLYRSSKSNGTELRYLRQDKSDDSASKHEWSSASAKYTGGKLYMLGGSTGASSYTVTFNYNGHGTTTTQTVTAGGKAARPADPTATGYKFVSWNTSSGAVYDFNSAVNSSFTLYARWDIDDSGSGSGGESGSSTAVYKGSGTVSFSKDKYNFDVYIYVEDGKIVNITSNLTTTPEESKSKTKYHPNAVAVLLNQLKGKDATSASVDAVSGGTPKYSYAALKKAITEALGGVVQEQKAVINVDTADMTLTEGGTSTRAATKEGCTISATSSDPAVATVRYNDNTNTITVTGVKEGTATITVTGTATDGYTAPAKKTFTVTVSDGSSGTAIINPSGVSGNDLSLTKVLSSSGSGDNTTYTITLTGKATKAAEAGVSYSKIATGKNYTYATLSDGSYYYLYSGTYYQLKGVKYDNKYYIYITVGSTDYGLKKDGTLERGRYKGEDADSQTKEILKKDKFKTSNIYKAVSSGTTTGIGSSAVLKDTINTTYFDLSGATATANISGINPSLNGSTGLVTVTGYNYSGNYGTSGTSELVVTIRGLKLKDSVGAGTYPSNSGNAGIYASSSSSSALVSIGSPQLTVAAETVQKSYTLTYNANGGSSAPAAQTGKSADDSYTFVVTSAEPTYSGHTFLGWSEDSKAATPGFIAGESVTVQKDSTGNTGSKTLYAVWEKNTTAGKYVDGTTVVERYGYQSIVTVTVDENGNIKAITATPGGAEGYSLQLFNDALAALQEELEGKPASAATVNSFPGTDASVDAVSGATLSANALKIAISKAIQAKNLIQWKDAEEKGGAVLDQAYFTDGTTPFYTGEDLGTSFKEWTPEITAASGSKDYTAVYYDTDDYTLTAEDMVMDLRANPLSAGLRNGNWGITPENLDGKMYPYPVLELKAGSTTILSHEKGYKTDSENGYQYSYTTDNENVAKQFVVNGTGMPELELSGAPGRANMELTIRDKDDKVLATKAFTVTVNPCTITWNVNGTPVTTLANVDSTPVSGLNPAQEGKTFLGWSTDPDAKEGKPETELPKADGNVTYYAIFGQAETPEEAYPDGTYGDYSGSVNITRANGTVIADYKPILIVTVKDGKITDVKADADEKASDRNREYLNDAITGIKDQLVGKDAYPSVIGGIDTVSGATVSADVLKAEAAAAFAAGPKDTYTVEWDPDNSDEKTINKSVTYGTRTASLQPEEDPVKTGEGAEYTFQKWVSEADQTADPAFFVTENASYKALYDVKETADGHHIIFEDYTKGGATIDGLGSLNTMESNSSCKVTSNTYSGDTTFTLSADIATAAAIHTDGTKTGDEILMDQNGTYTRLTCTENDDGTYAFTVPVTDSDVYVVLAYKGDVNLDGRVKFLDAGMADKISLGTSTNITSLMKMAGDVNKDGNVKFIDAGMIDRASLGTYTFPWDLK